MKLRHALGFALLLAAAAAGCSGSPNTGPRNVTNADKDRKDNKDKKGTDKGNVSRPREGPKGKGKPGDSATKPPPAPNPGIEVVKDGDGVIAGVVRWSGPVPAAAGTARAKDMTVLVNGEKVPVVPTPRVAVDPHSKGLSNVVVWLAKPPTDAAPFNPEDLVLRQSRGSFEPHLAVVGRGSRLRLRTADDSATFLVSRQASTARTLMRGQTVTIPLKRTGLVVVRSGEQPWMTPAYIRVLDHTYYAISDGDGNFKLPRVPPGEYEVVLWHEGWVSDDARHPGEHAPLRLEVPVKIGPGQGATIRWTAPVARAGS
jgi:hypothetical protein